MEWGMVLSLIIGALLLSMLAGIPIAFSLGGLAAILIIFLVGPKGYFLFASTAFGEINNFSLIAIPLFIFMAEVITFSGLVGEFFAAARQWLSWLPASLAVASELGCTFFAALTGSSTANAAAFGVATVPEMLKYGYDKRLAAGAIVAGGALGGLIPPSIFLIVYGVMSETSIGGLFIGGLLPGLILSGLFISYIIIRAVINPAVAPKKAGGVTWESRFASLLRVWPVVALIFFMLVSIYTGIATPTEVAGCGAFFAILIALGYRKLSWDNLRASFLRTVQVTVMIMWILVAAHLFGYVLARLQLPQQLTAWTLQMGFSNWTMIILINILLLLLGCIIDPLGILVLTLPLFLPIIKNMGFDPLWFGVMFCINMEAALITPPLGFNLYILKGTVPEVLSLADVIIGAAPFVVLDCVCLAIVIIFPEIILWLPSLMLAKG